MDPSSEKSLFVPGAVIGGRYEVIDSLGSGGMGTVVRVIDRALDNEVLALKLLYPHMAKDQTQFARFRNEVLIARKLAHPNIVRLFDFGAAGQGYYYISMEYVQGGNLADRIYTPEDQRMTFTECLEILYEICLGLASAHSYGVVHRDLKPDNILMTETGQVKISDFGLARSVAIERGLTATGDTVGTPYYMAPEQLRGDKLDARVDLYALGIVAYEMVMGKRPFMHDTYLTLAAMHFREPIPKFTGKESGIPKWYQEFVEKLAAKKPEDRYKSAKEAAETIGKHLANSSSVEIRRKPAVLSLYETVSVGGRSKLMTFLGWSCMILAVVVGVLAAAANKDTLTSGMAALLGTVERPAPPSQESENADPQFFSQVREGDSSMVEFFLNRGANANAKDQAGTSALHYAVSAKENRTRLIGLLFSRGAQPDNPDRNGITPLMYAAREGYADAAEELIEVRADLKAKDANGRTALHYAVLADNADMVELLVNSGAPVNALDNQFKPPADYIAPRSPHRSRLRTLLAAGKSGEPVRASAAAGVRAVEAKSSLEPAAEADLRVLDFSKKMTRPIANAWKLSAKIENAGDGPARGIAVYAKLADGKSVRLAGLPELSSKEQAVYEVEFIEHDARNVKQAELRLSCLNCKAE